MGWILRRIVYTGTVAAGAFYAGWKGRERYDATMGAARPSSILARASKFWDGLTKGDPKDRVIRKLQQEKAELAAGIDRVTAEKAVAVEQTVELRIMYHDLHADWMRLNGNKMHRSFGAENDRGSNQQQRDDKNLQIKRVDDRSSNQNGKKNLPIKKLW